MIILLLCGVSVAVTLVAFNNFTSSLHNEDIIERETIKSNTQKCIKYITVVTFLAIVTLLGLICDVLFDAPSFLFAALPATTVVGGIIAYLIHSFLYKKFEIVGTGLSPEQKIYRRKHIKVTSIILAVVVSSTFLLPFIFAWHETSEYSIYSYPDGVGYQYDSEQEAEMEYYKLKDYVSGKKTLYYVTYEDYAEETDEYILYVEPLQDFFEYNGNGYIMVETKLAEEEELRFKNLDKEILSLTMKPYQLAINREQAIFLVVSAILCPYL